jgi:hypothetical protein
MIINYYFGFNEQLSLNKLGFCQEVSWPFFCDATRHRAVALRSFLAFLLLSNAESELCGSVVLQLSQFFLLVLLA